MKAPTNEYLASSGEGEKKIINSELWHACAGPLVSLPPVGSLVIYFPQGHSEQVAASMQKETDCIPTYPNLPSKLICTLHNVTLHADPETDEVYAQMTLQPVSKYEKEAVLASDIGLKHSRQPAEFFCKTLTASDTSTHGGFSVPRRAAEKIFPPLDFTLQPPAQELVARDLHDSAWTFRHIYRGQPKRHLLTTGWSVFVSTKRLFAGDSVLFIRDEKSQLMLGLRRANRQLPALSSSVISSDSMHIGILAAAAHAAANNSQFTIFYNPRASPSEFVIPLAKYNKAMYAQVSLGMRFRMMFETEESGVRRYMGTVTSVSDLDPVRWKSSQWRNLQVGWDESTAGNRPSRVSIWEIEPVVTPFYICPPPFFRPKFPRQSGLPDDGSDMENAFKRGLPCIGDDFGMKDAASSLFPGLSLVQWMNMQQNNQFPATQSGFFPSMISSLNTDDPSKLLSFQNSVLSNTASVQFNQATQQIQANQFHQTPSAWSHQPSQQQQLPQPQQPPQPQLPQPQQLPQPHLPQPQLPQPEPSQQLPQQQPPHQQSSQQQQSQQQLFHQQQLQQIQQHHMQQPLFQQGLVSNSIVPQNQIRDQIMQQSVMYSQLQQQQQLLAENTQSQQGTYSANRNSFPTQEFSFQQQMEQKSTILQTQMEHKPTIMQREMEQTEVQLSQQSIPGRPEHQQQMLQPLQQRLAEQQIQVHLLQKMQHQKQQQQRSPQNQQQNHHHQQQKLLSPQPMHIGNSLSTSAHMLSQQFPMSQLQSSTQKPLALIRTQSGLTEGDTPSCSTSPSTNNCQIPTSNFPNRNKKEPPMLLQDLAVELPNNNTIQELQNKSNMRVTNELSTLKVPNPLKNKGVVPDLLEGCSSVTSYCFEAGSLHQNISVPTSFDGAVQSHQQNNLPHTINYDGLTPDTSLSRGFGSGKDLQMLLSNYGDTPRDIETELSTAAIPINDQSFGVPDLSFKAGCTNDVAINDTGLLNGGIWANQTQPLRTYTKVQKRGSVGRSIDVIRYKGYDELKQDLAHMFGIEGQLNDPQRTDWKLVYVDHENDILLVGDDPWDEFVTCVQSIKILSTAEVQQMSLDGDLGPLVNQACSGTDSENKWQGNYDNHSAASFNR